MDCRPKSDRELTGSEGPLRICRNVSVRAAWSRLRGASPTSRKSRREKLDLSRLRSLPLVSRRPLRSKSFPPRASAEESRPNTMAVLRDSPRVSSSGFSRTGGGCLVSGLWRWPGERDVDCPEKRNWAGLLDDLTDLKV